MITQPIGLENFLLIFNWLKFFNFFRKLSISCSIPDVCKIFLLAMNHQNILNIVVFWLVTIELFDKFVAKDLDKLCVSNDHEGYNISH
jgi:hypothetical protein